jgi:hypothetical protein
MGVTLMSELPTHRELPADRGDHPAEPARRGFLRAVGAMPVALAAGCSAADPAQAADPPTKSLVDDQTLPQIRLGSHSISRVICGANCFNGGSHLSVFVNRAMKEYYSEEQVFQTLKRCEQVGINCWQAGVGNIEMYRRFVDRGLRQHYIAIAAGDASNVTKLAAGGCVAIAHHGEVTDRLFKSGQLDRAREFLKRVRDAGLVVGVSTHMPDVVDAIESDDWDIDYYMTCVYERHRSKEDLESLLGQAPIPVGEVYLPNDPPRMFQAVRQTRRPCLAFKILAAGRLSDRQHWVEQAFQDTFAAIKPTDGVIVGIYDRYSDQPAENAEYARRFGSPAVS